MNNQRVWRGVVLIGVALFFGLQSLSYHLGTLARAGAGLFPLMISVALGLIGLVMLVQARFEAVEQLRFNPRNLAIVVVSLIGFVLIAEHLNVTLAIIWLVFISTFAGSDYSLSRNVKITAVLLAIAAAFRYLLGLNLRLW